MRLLAGTLLFNDKEEILLLLKKKHNHYELPGGTVEESACKDFSNPSIDELRNEAERELCEEIGDVKISELEYFTKFQFTIPDGRVALIYTFKARLLSGEPKLNEPEIFSDIRFFSLKELKKVNIAPNVRILLDKLE